MPSDSFPISQFAKCVQSISGYTQPFAIPEMQSAIDLDVRAECTRVEVVHVLATADCKVRA